MIENKKNKMYENRESKRTNKLINEFNKWKLEVLTEKLITAIKRKNLNEVKDIIKSGASVNAKDSFSYTPLMWAARIGSVKIAKFLIEKGADVNAKNNGGMTALMHAKAYCHEKVARLLIKSGARVRARDIDGHDADWYSFVYGHIFKHEKDYYD
jgi:ankyrin repeat protein